MKDKPRKTTVACPQCSKHSEWSAENPFRPFCSERCRLIDLGAWAAEEYQIASQSSENDYSSSFEDPESRDYMDKPLH